MLIPYSTDRELQRAPVATITIIAVCTVIEIIAVGHPQLREMMAFNPEKFAIWQPLTAMFAHGDPMHLIGNMLFLWVFGSHVEDTVGIPKYLLLFVTAGFAGTWLQGVADVMLMDTIRGGLGASGAIMGMISPFALRYRNTMVNVFYWQWVFGTFQIRALYVGIFYFAMDLLTGSGMAAMGVQGMVANFAHVGGFACGIVWALLMRMPAAATLEEARDTAASYAASGAYKAAADMLDEAIRRDPTDPDLHRQVAQYLTRRPNDAPRACAEWSTAFRLWLRREEPETALDNWLVARKSFRPEQFDPAVALQMALLAEKRDLPQEVADIYSAVATAPAKYREAPLAALRLADMLTRQGHPVQARQWYEYLTRTWPNSEESLAAEAHLKRSPA